VAGDKELLDTAKDYFQFVSRFFEVIKCSAPHIYHSALEMSPEESIVRNHYYQWTLGHHTPHILCGIPRSWEHPAVVNGRYRSYAWSPCGQFLSAQTPTSVEIWDSLTLEKQSSLQLPRPAHTNEPPSPISDTLSYSPDGHSLVSFSGSAITTWDIQTGGVVKEIKCSDIGIHPRSLVWSLDGQTIGAIFPREAGTWVVCTYDIDLGVKVSTCTLQSFCKPQLWPQNNTLQIMTILPSEDSQAIVNIFEIWPTFINAPTKSFPIELNLSHVKHHTISFSPAVCRISAITKDQPLQKIVILDIQSSKILLLEEGYFTSTCFSPDGSLVLASTSSSDTYIWRHYSEEGYTLWMRYPDWSNFLSDAQNYQLFSPTLSSVLISRSSCFEMKQLDDSGTTHRNRYWYYEQFSTYGTYVVTAPDGGQIVTITNLNEIHSQSIKPGFSVCGLFLTGNVLFVLGHDKFAGWCLTEEGIINYAPGNGVSGKDGRLWTISNPGWSPQFWNNSRVGAVRSPGQYALCYNLKTGEKLDFVPDTAPSIFSPYWVGFDSGPGNFEGKFRFFSYCRFPLYNNPPKKNLSIVIPWYADGWVKYPEGKHQHKFWLPTHWRSNRYWAHWLNDVTTLRLDTTSGLVIIKFHLESPLECVENPGTAESTSTSLP